jgi:hypothetical protein
MLWKLTADRYLRSLRGKIRNSIAFCRRHPLASATWIFCSICLTVTLSLVISTGPEIQRYALALIRSDASSIYGPAYQDSLARFPSLGQWMAACLQMPFLVTSALIVVFSFGGRGARSVFVSGVLVSYLVLVVIDIVAGFSSGAISGAYILENLTANAVGAVIVAFVLIAIMVVAHLCFVNLSGPPLLRGSGAACVAILLGICINATVYYTTDFFYRPIPVQLDVILDAPVTGSIGSAGRNEDRKTSPRAKDDPQPFQIFPGTVADGSLRWNSPADDTKFAVKWSKLARTGTFDVTIEFFADCFADGMNSSPSVDDHVVKIQNVSDLEISLDAGAAEFGTLDRAKMSGKLVTEFGSLGLFSLDSDSGSRTSKTTVFVGKSTELSIRSDGRSVGFYINAPLFSTSGSGIAASGRTMTVRVDGRAYAIEAAKPRTTSKTIGELACRSVDALGAVKRDRAKVGRADVYTGAVIRVEKRPAPSAIFGVEESMMQVLGGNGWISFARPTASRAAGERSGFADFLAFKGNVVSMDVDKSSTTARPIDEYHAFGEFTGSFEDSAKMRFAGVAKAFWKNGSRENPTKWEKLTWERGGPLLAAVISMLAGIIGFTAIRIRNDVQIDWRTRLE